MSENQTGSQTMTIFAYGSKSESLSIGNTYADLTAAEKSKDLP